MPQQVRIVCIQVANYLVSSCQRQHIFCLGQTMHSVNVSVCGNVSYRAEGCLQLPRHFIGIITGTKKKSEQDTFDCTSTTSCTERKCTGNCKTRVFLRRYTFIYRSYLYLIDKEVHNKIINTISPF